MTMTRTGVEIECAGNFQREASVIDIGVTSWVIRKSILDGLAQTLFSVEYH